MKNRCVRNVLTVFLLLVGYACYGQDAPEPRVGIKGGFNASNLFIDDVDDENMRLGFHAGVYGQIPLAKMLAIQPELLYSTRGAAADYDIIGYEGTNKFNLHYVDLPVLAVIKLGDFVEVNGGVYAGYLVVANVSTEGDFGNEVEDIDRDHFNKLDYGLTGGVTINLDPIAFGARYSYGLNKIADSDIANTLLGDAKNSYAQLFIALNLNP